MIPEFSWLPPEINSARIFAGAGSEPLLTAASAWDGLVQELQTSAGSFHSVIAGLTAGPWAGPASESMAAVATPYVGWLNSAAGHAALMAGQARAAATAFETALTAMVHPAIVTANRTALLSLIATNFLGQHATAIATNEFNYMEMWAQDVAAMIGYHAGATSAASTLTPLGGLGTELTGIASRMSAAIPAAMSALKALPIQDVSMLMYPASMATQPLMMMMSNATRGSTAGLAGSTAAALPASVPKSALAGVKALGAGGLGSAMSAGLGKARLVGAMSVPSGWQGSTPAGMGSAAMRGLGKMPNSAAGLQAAGASAGRMTPMPMPMGGAGAGMGGAMMGRGGASPNTVQKRPCVVPRTGV